MDGGVGVEPADQQPEPPPGGLDRPEPRVAEYRPQESSRRVIDRPCQLCQAGVGGWGEVGSDLPAEERLPVRHVGGHWG